MREILIMVALIVMAMIFIGPAAAHHGPSFTCGPHDFGTCPEGKHCDMTSEGYWGPWGITHNGDCPWFSDGSCEEFCIVGNGDGCGIGYKTAHHHRTYYEPEYVCIQDTCGEDFQCEEGFHCGGENTCVPDVCGVDFTCQQGFHCEGGSCVQDPQSGYWPAPFTTNECGAFLGVNRPMDDLDPATLPMLNLKNTLVRLEAVVPQGMNDCVGIAWYGNGETSYFGDTPHVEYYNLQQLKEVGYGQDVIVQAKLPVQAVCLLVVKDEICDSATMEHIIVTDSHGTVGLDLHTTQRVYHECFQLPKDFQGWRPTTDTMLFSIF
jgi:hypothetical protein